MGEVVVSALFPVLLEKLTSEAVKSIARYKGFDAEIKKWNRLLNQIQDVLADASQKEITSQSVKRWLNDLQHLAYDMDDVLDDLSTDAMHREFTHQSEAITDKLVRNIIPSCCTSFPRSTKMLVRLDSINAKLQDLFKEKDNLGLKMDGEIRPRNGNNNRSLQTCFYDPSSVVGRKAEKEELVRQLLADGPSHKNFSIVPIVGMGGVGKTTLAKLLYAEKQVNDHFKLKAWVCVSDEFDSFRISKVIFQSVAGENKEFADLNLLQVDLEKHLKGQRFMLVLDDVWTESHDDWNILVGPFHKCAPGSKIIITTRKGELIEKLGFNLLNCQLGILSPEDALSLVAHHAFGVNTFDSHSSLKPVGEGIVKKCNGLPLALIALGTLLRTKKDEDSWKKVLNSDIWSLKDGGGILPALRISYNDLSAPLKQLFRYCSLFPKDYMFDKEELTLLWMAEGFLHHEDIGHEYFDELLSKSFFQHAPNNEPLYVMHDLMNDLATNVAGEFFVRLGNEAENNIRKEMIRHMSFVREEYVAYKIFEAFKGATSLRTFLATSVGVVNRWEKFYLSNKIMVNFLCELPFLRVLSLSNFQISEVPESIGTLRHLRYLNLSQTEIKHLPEDVSNLYNLETLILFGCMSLAKLPNSFLKLKKLRHLDVRRTQLLEQMPLGIGELKSLQTLSKIIIGGKSGFEIAKLKDLENLCGEVSIEVLDNVQNAIDARVASLPQKRLSKLEVVWSDLWDASRNEILEKQVLNELRPLDDKLVQLKIRSYGGLEFPNWVGGPSFRHLKHVSVRGCKRCMYLPPLAELPSLKELFIEELDGVKVVGMELLGTGGAFPSLEILSFKKMHGWEKWSTNNDDTFPCLKHLVIEDCPNLVEVSVGALNSLEDLLINKCDSGVLRRLVEVASIVTKLKISSISRLDDKVWRGVIEDLGAIEDLSIGSCNEIRYLWESEAVASKVLRNLRNLNVSRCRNLIGLGKEKEEDNCRYNFLTSLTRLEVYSCDNMERFSCPDSIETLKVSSCSSITSISFPSGGQRLKSLNVSDCEKLLEREWGGQKMNTNRSSIMPMLEDVRIGDSPILESIIELNCLVHLTRLILYNCEGLENNIRKEMIRHMSFVREKYVVYENFEAFKGATSLRTFLATSVGVVNRWEWFFLSNKIMVDFLCELPFLRVLSLSNFRISEVPESIGTLRHLRYLNLSQTGIKHLPEDVSNLYNLETLILFGCERLVKLPNSFKKLKKLRHLDIRKTQLLGQMPFGIGELKSLQTLSKIIIGGKSGFEIAKLKDLENLCGEVSIEGLDNVQNAIDARVANFPQKRLSKLKVVWSDRWNNSRNEMLEKDIFNELMPRNDKLIHLKIRSYGGLEFPNWVGDPLFLHLKHVSMRGCKRCTYLPPLAELPSLKELFIEDLDGVKVVGMELLGTGGAFPSLEILSFKKMHGWEKWSTNNDDAFPCLKHLVIEDCPNLVEVSVGGLNSLDALLIDKCDSGVLRRLVEVASIVTKLKISSISRLDDKVWRGVIEDLGAIEDLSIGSCNEIRYLWESEAVASKVLRNLRNLNVSRCRNLIGLGKEKEEDNCRYNFLTSLTRLEVYSCDNMERFSCPDSIETLKVSSCSSITSISFPSGGQRLKSLSVVGGKKLLEREWGGQKMNNNRSSNMPMLEDVRIINSPILESIIELNCLVHLTGLSLINCEGLESLPDNEFPNLTSLTRLEIRDCSSMDACFPRGLWPPNLQSLKIGKLKKPISEWGSQNFPTSLVDLWLVGGGEDGVSSCSQFSNLLPSSLTSLRLVHFEKLESFSIQLQHLQRLSFYNCPILEKLSHPHPHPHPQHLTSIQHLFFQDCPNLMDLPEEVLPSLLSLMMGVNCPKLKERCSKGGGSYWPLISHITYIDII